MQSKVLKAKYGQLNDAGQQATAQPDQNPSAYSNPQPNVQTNFGNGMQQTNPMQTPQEYAKKAPLSPTQQENIARLENYNASRLAIRNTTEFFPASKKVQKSSNIPLGSMIQPFASVYSYQDFPTVSFGPNHSIVRCDECRAYVNPFTKFLDNGSKYRCNICGHLNAVPSYYFSGLNQQGEREDKASRVELNNGIYDIKAGTDYMTRPPVPPTYYFILDVSQKAIESGMLDIFVNILNELITNDQFPGTSRTAIGIMTYDTTIHLYNLKPTLKNPQMIVVSDLEEFYTQVPLPEDLIVNLSESKTVIQQLLNSFSSMFATTTNTGSCLTQCIELATKIMKSIGGRMIILQGGNGIMSEKSISVKTQGADKAQFLIPTGAYFSNLTGEMQTYFISCDMFIYSDSFKNAITIGELPRYMNGDLHYYPEEPERPHKFYYDLKNALLREYTWETVFRVRISGGWKVQNIYGNFSIKSSDLLGVPNMDDSKGIFYEFTLDDEIARADVFYLQTALLYTNIYGERRIRVMNSGVPLTHQTTDIQEKIDSQAVACFLFRQGLANIYKSMKIPDVRNEIMNKARLIISEVTNQTSYTNTQAQLPDSIATFPMAILGILKSPIFSTSNIEPNKELDAKNALRIKLNALNLEETMLHFVPYLFSVHTLSEENTSYFDENGYFVFPSLVNLSFNNLSNEGIYLLDDGEALYMLTGSQADPTKLMNLFGIKSVAEVPQLTEDLLYHNSTDDLVTRVYNLITELRIRKFDKYAYLYIIKEGEKSKAEREFYLKLIEDKINTHNVYAIGYQEFVDQLMRPRM
jgi:protein transport protein SEC24